MSTTYFMNVENQDIEIARTHFNGEVAEVTWLNELAVMLIDEEMVMSDSGNPLCLTVGELRELESGNLAEQQLRVEIEELKQENLKLKEECFETRCAADHFEDELVDTEKELESVVSESLDLKETRKNLSNAIQESLDREAELRAENRALQKKVNDTLDELEIVTRREQHFLECLKEEQNLNLNISRDNRKLERELREAKWDVVETENFTVTFFNETFEDGRGASFEHNTRGEDFAGGLWFGTDFEGEASLRDYDGVGILPMEVAKAVRSKGFSTNNIVTTSELVK